MLALRSHAEGGWQRQLCGLLICAGCPACRHANHANACPWALTVRSRGSYPEKNWDDRTSSASLEDCLTIRLSRPVMPPAPVGRARGGRSPGARKGDGGARLPAPSVLETCWSALPAWIAAHALGMAAILDVDWERLVSLECTSAAALMRCVPADP